MEVTLKNHFWKWFEFNSEIYHCIDQMTEQDVQYWMDEIEVHLWAYCKDLEPCICLPVDGTTRKLIISAGGNYNYFKSVEELVSQAPQIPGWEVVAFYPPRPIDYRIEELYGHTGIDPHNLLFIPSLVDDEPPYILVLSEAYKTEDQEFAAAVEAVIINLLGERSANLDISAVVVNCWDDFYAEERSGMMKLQELPAYLERVNTSSVFINGQGQIEDKKGM